MTESRRYLRFAIKFDNCASIAAKPLTSSIRPNWCTCTPAGRKFGHDLPSCYIQEWAFNRKAACPISRVAGTPRGDDRELASCPGCLGRCLAVTAVAICERQIPVTTHSDGSFWRRLQGEL